MKNFKQKSPVLLSAMAIVLFFVLTWLLSFVWTVVPIGIFTAFAVEIIGMLIPFLFVVIFGDIKVYAKGGFFKTLGAGAYIVVIQLLGLWGTATLAVLSPDTKWQSTIGIFYGVATLVGIGFREESLFRGLCVDIIAKKYAKDSRGILFTALISAVMFGAVHMTNAFYGVSVQSAVIQSLAAMGVGFYLSAVYLRGGSLWAMIFIHSLIDTVSLFASSFTQGVTSADLINNLSVINIAPLFTFGALGFFVLRKSKREEIISRYNPIERKNAVA